MTLTSSPDIFCAYIAVLPSTEMPLHVAVKVIPRAIHQSAVVGYIKPFVQVFVVVAPSATNDDTSVRSRNHIVVLVVGKPHHITISHLWCVLARQACYYASHWDDFFLHLRYESRRVSVRSINESAGLDGATRCVHDPTIFCAFIGCRDGRYWGICLQVDAHRHRFF